MSLDQPTSSAESTTLERACAALNQGEYKRAVELFLCPELMHDRVALNCLAWCYLCGKGAEEDAVKAVQCLREAIGQGYWKAACNLARMYEHGIGVEKDDHAAFELYKQAAVHGETIAEDELSRMYRTGTGVGKDEENANYWSQEAARERAQSAPHKHFIVNPFLFKLKEPEFWLKWATWLTVQALLNSLLMYEVFPLFRGFAFLGTPADALKLALLLSFLGILVPLIMAVLLTSLFILLAMVLSLVGGGAGTGAVQSAPVGQPSGIYGQLINWLVLLLIYSFAVRILADFFPNTFVVETWPTTIVLASILSAGATTLRAAMSPHTERGKKAQERELTSMQWVFD